MKSSLGSDSSSRVTSFYLPKSPE